MYKDIRKRVFLTILVLLSTFSLCTACGNDGEMPIPTIPKSGVMEFEDFTVERSVRANLGKSWDEDITYEEVATIKNLTISSAYDPSFIQKNARMEYTGYINLIDLENFVNLEELILNVYVNHDSIVNLDSITNCKKLKRLSVPCNTAESTKTVNLGGYKYWADIVAELPKLEYLDLGMYVDDHMKKAILGKSKNKKIEFYQGDIIAGDNGDMYGYLKMSNAAPSLAYRIPNAAEYNSAWDYSFPGYVTMRQNFSDISYDTEQAGVFPMLHGTYDDVLSQLNMLSDDTEDIIIKLWGNSFDFSVLSRFKNLVSFTIIGVDNTKVLDWSSGNVSFKGIEPINLEALTSLEHLQVLNLNSMQGNLQQLANCQNLRELTLDVCYTDNLEFISELRNLKELTLGIFTLGKSADVEEEYWKNLGDEVCTLDNLKFYKDRNVMNGHFDCYTNIDYMSSLETLYLDDSYSRLDSILKNSSIENFLIWAGRDLKEQIPNRISFENMHNLKVCNLSINEDNLDIDYESLLGLSNLQTVYLPRTLAIHMENILIPELADKIVAHKNLSAFVSYVGKEYEISYKKKTDEAYMKKLYDANVFCGIGYYWNKKQWAEGITDSSFEDIFNLIKQ